MKRIMTLVFLFVSFFSVIPCLAITRDKLVGLLATADTVKSSKYALEVAMANLNTVEEILLIPSGHPVARHSALSCLGKATRDGKIPITHFFAILVNQIKNISTFSKVDWASDDLVSISNMISCFSYFPQDGSGVSVKENFENLSILIDSFSSAGFFRNQGLANSIKTKVSNSQGALVKGQTIASVNILSATMNEISAQIDKGIRNQSAQILLKYISNLVAQIQSK